MDNYQLFLQINRDIGTLVELAQSSDPDQVTRIAARLDEAMPLLQKILCPADEESKR